VKPGNLFGEQSKKVPIRQRKLKDERCTIEIDKINLICG